MYPSPLVSTEWLAAHLDDPQVRIVDIRGHVLPATEAPPHYFNHHADYVQAHIPGAVFVDWVHEITDPADPRHAQIAPPDRYTAVMRRLGIHDDTYVVTYDDAGGMFAARLWWSLHYYGHARVSVLDGGWQQWTGERRWITAIEPKHAPGTFTARPQAALRVTADEVRAHLGEWHLLDMRSKEEYDGQASRAKRAGHIPGAVSLPRRTLMTAGGLMLAPDQLRAHLAELGVHRGGDDVVFYCNAGVSASFGLLALRAAGYEGGRVYDGSWKDWGNREDTPIA